MSRFLEIAENIIRSTTGSLTLVLLVIGLLTMLLGAILNVGGIIVIGIFLLGIGALIFLIGLIRR
jgi:hypothetical protein